MTRSVTGSWCSTLSCCSCSRCGYARAAVLGAGDELPHLVMEALAGRYDHTVLAAMETTARGLATADGPAALAWDDVAFALLCTQQISAKRREATA